MKSFNKYFFVGILLLSGCINYNYPGEAFLISANLNTVLDRLANFQRQNYAKLGNDDLSPESCTLKLRNHYYSCFLFLPVEGDTVRMLCRIHEADSPPIALYLLRVVIPAPSTEVIKKEGIDRYREEIRKHSEGMTINTSQLSKEENEKYKRIFKELVVEKIFPNSQLNDK